MNHTSLTSWPPSISSIGRTSTPGVVMSMSSIEMPACFFTSGSVRTSVKIQSPYWPSVVQVFWPLTTQSSPSRTAVVRRRRGRSRRRARRSPATTRCRGWRSSGRKRSFCSCDAELRDDRPDHRGVEGQRDRHAGALHLLVPEVPLEVGPVLAAPLDRPVRHGEARGVEGPLGLDDLVAGQVAPLERPCRGSPGDTLVVKNSRISSRNSASVWAAARAACDSSGRGPGAHGRGPAAPSWRGRPNRVAGLSPVSRRSRARGSRSAPCRRSSR